MPELLLIPEIADLTRVPIDTIRWYRHRQSAGYDEGPRMFKLGARIVADKADVLAWIEASRAAAGPAA
jgi:predicted DNA-binding transcriptional regulator AlpA